MDVSKTLAWERIHVSLVTDVRGKLVRPPEGPEQPPTAEAAVRVPNPKPKPELPPATAEAPLPVPQPNLTWAVSGRKRPESGVA